MKAATIKAELQPGKGFTDAQREDLSRQWLQVTQKQVDQINEALPAHTQVATLEFGGNLYLGADLLTDTDKTYAAARELIEALVPVALDPEQIKEAQAVEVPK